MRETENRSIEDVVSYSDNRQHLSDELRKLDLILRLEMTRQGLFSKSSVQHAQYRGLVLFDEDMAGLLSSQGSLFDDQNSISEEIPEISSLLDEIRELESHIKLRLDAVKETGIYLALPHLSHIFGLSPREELCLIICLAAELDLKYERLYAYLNDDITKKRATIGLILRLISRSPAERAGLRQILEAGSKLLKYGLLRSTDQSDDSSSWASKTVRLDERIVNFLLGHGRIDSRLDDVATLYTPQDAESMDDGCYAAGIADRIREFVGDCLFRRDSQRSVLLIHLYGPSGSGKLKLVRKACQELGVLLLAGDIEKIMDRQQPLPDAIRLLGREALLQQAALCLDNFHYVTDDKEKERHIVNSLLESIHAFSPLAFMLSERSWRPRSLGEDFTFIDIGLEIPGSGVRLQIWDRYRKLYDLQLNDDDIAELAGRFRFTGGRIRDAVLTARNLSLWTSLSDRVITKKHIYEGCRSQSKAVLSSLARKIRPLYGWDDIILPQHQKRMMREICSQMKYGHIVYGEWSFDRKIPFCEGLTILFSGQSGTGKTMAAQVIANELGLDLYKIDLSQIVSKYIGETEKNLDKVFTEARSGNSILFFDEADALFGKRSEVRDAHDRYANIEISYLLQKMEEFEGITILATNLRNNLDEAFLRRMRFSIEFPFPDERQREAIWRKMFPEAAPLSADVDFAFLSEKFRITGGNIRNICLQAAFYAAEESSDIKMRHIIFAVKRELQKIGKLCVRGDFGKYYDLIDGEML